MSKLVSKILKETSGPLTGVEAEIATLGRIVFRKLSEGALILVPPFSFFMASPI